MLLTGDLSTTDYTPNREMDFNKVSYTTITAFMPNKLNQKNR